MIKVGDLVKFYQDKSGGSIGVVIGEQATGYGWQRLFIQIGNDVYDSSTLQVRLIQNEDWGYSKSTVRNYEKA